MHTPTVSFVVPCYKLAHFLGDCLHSILSQSYTDFEVIIMDDCSPDHTQNIAASFHDHRIRYVRNDHNLGHLRNYNRGIGISRGKYVWLISADDRLRQPYILQRYLELLNGHPQVGYVFCPGVGLDNDTETTVLPYYCYGGKDKIFKGRDFVATVLRQGGGLLSPSVLARRECYDRSGMFPLDMPHQADLYLWFAWALEYNVGYLAEPMVNYRSHDQNMMKALLRQRIDLVFDDEVKVLWRTKRLAEERGFRRLTKQLKYCIAEKYARAAMFEYAGSPEPWGMSIIECNQALRNNAHILSEYRRLRGTFKASYANKQWRQRQFRNAQRSYASALCDEWRMPVVWLKCLFLSIQLGRFGLYLRNLRAKLRAGRAPGIRRTA